ncbi:MAG: aminodeoxychorismate lyase [Bacillus sp. (in: firmicutes)]
MIMYVNGQFVEEAAAVISPFDHGFMYGMGLFETIRVYEGHPFLLDDHIDRMTAGLEEMDIKNPFSREKWLSLIKELLDVNGISNARVRLNVSAGVGQAGLPSGPYYTPSTILFISPLGHAPDSLAAKKARILELKRDVPFGKSRHKTHHFGNNIAAKMELNQHPEDEGIFLTEGGHIAEAITSNIFWVKNEVLYTPSLDTGILPGTSRKFIMGLAKTMDIPIREGLYSCCELACSEEVFLTNAVQEIVPLEEIRGLASYPGKDGKVANRLYMEYKKWRSTLWTSKSLHDK